MDGHIQEKPHYHVLSAVDKGIYKKPTDIMEKRDYAFSMGKGWFLGFESPRINFY